MGYHLRVCSYCQRWRLFKRGDKGRPHPDDMTMEELQESFNRKIAMTAGKPPESSETLAGDAISNLSEEASGLEAAADGSSAAVTEIATEVEDGPSCPRCGGTLFRRSHRRWYERLIRRPRMARCLKCDHRFPYVR